MATSRTLIALIFWVSIMGIAGCGGGTGSQVDLTPPDRVMDLTAGTSMLRVGAVQLVWTAVGDSEAADGRVDAYDLRCSTSPLSGATWDGATKCVQNWVPLAPGSVEVHEFRDLAPGVEYFFALRTRDALGNASPLSNVARAVAASDVTAPSGISDLGAVTSSTALGAVDLTWTAPGEDGSTGGAVTAYEVRYSTSPINTANWGTIPVFAQTWAPLPPGRMETREVNGLIPGTPYFFVIVSSDEVGNSSPFSNIAMATAASDITPPAAISDLSAAPSASTQGGVDLSWTAVGDDGTAGTATAYDLRYSTLPITPANWSGATVWSQTGSPLAAGGRENKTVLGLVPGTLYYFAVRTLDEVSNVSPLSNVANAQAFQDAIPPAAVTDLTGTAGPNYGDIQLSWTASGDDATSGTATSYVLKVDTSPIDATNFAAAPAYAQTWTPSAPGTMENQVLTGLGLGRTYFIALKVLDDVSNASAISNVVTCTTTTPDPVPPAPITDLAATVPLAWGTVDLRWTAVGDDGVTGTATSYEVRYSTSPITVANFTSATIYPQTWKPLPAGQGEVHTVTGLSADTLYYFAMVAMDEIPNASPLSNVVSAGTRKELSIQSPQPCGECLYGVWGASASDIFVVGTAGTILRGDGSTWNHMHSGTVAWLMDVWGTSSSNVLAVGRGGTILQFNGSVWSRVPGGITANLFGIWGTAQNDVFAVGDQGTILHFDGSTWSTMSSGTAQSLMGVWGNSSSDVFAVGNGGTILHYDGTSWTAMSSGVPDALCGVWGTSGNNVFAVGGGWVGARYSTVILQYNGASWTTVLSMNSRAFCGVWGTSASNVYAVGSPGIYQFNGAGWSNTGVSVGSACWGIWGSSGANILATGYGGTIYRYTGATWANTTSGSSAGLNDVWGSGPNDVFAVGDSGTVLHYDGTGWSAQNSTTMSQFHAVWGSSGSDVFAVGHNGLIVHYNGVVWSSMSSGVLNILFDVWGSSGSDVFAVGSGVILHYDGSSWTSMTIPTTQQQFRGVWGTSGSDVYAVGSAGTILHYDGSVWTTMNSGTAEHLYGIHGTSGSNIYAVGYTYTNGGTVLRYNGTNWTTMTSNLPDWLEGVWASSSSDVFVYGRDFQGVCAKVSRYDGTNWSYLAPRTASVLSGVWGSSGSDVYFVGGYFGTIMHYP